MFLWLSPATCFWIQKKNLKQSEKALPTRDTSKNRAISFLHLSENENVTPCIKYSWCPLHSKSCIDKINRRETVEVNLSHPGTLQPCEPLATCNVSQLLVLLAAILSELVPLPPHSEDPGVQWAGFSWGQGVQVGRLARFVGLISFANFLRNESEIVCKQQKPVERSNFFPMTFESAGVATALAFNFTRIWLFRPSTPFLFARKYATLFAQTAHKVSVARCVCEHLALMACYLLHFTLVFPKGHVNTTHATNHGVFLWPKGSRTSQGNVGVLQNNFSLLAKLFLFLLIHILSKTVNYL